MMSPAQAWLRKNGDSDGASDLSVDDEDNRTVVEPNISLPGVEPERMALQCRD
jgi:hypothetical protein